MNIFSLIIVAIVGEAVWENLKMIWQKGKLCIDKVGSLIISIILALDTGIDILALSGIPTRIPYVGTILTGIVISRGANFTHDIVSAINNICQNSKNTVENLESQEDTSKSK
ncbi:hypothetical protein IRP63_09350 [Clostridium botulinum]|uniref:Holin n=1 Tax=Clostridium botulinum C/D str. DC5 TaxID=1443128 RepID=A0A0A0ILL0_CLOBO|nr:hypothetical protein [Clostridium botulinum]KEI04660.1 hypothetical protein Z952_06765 [Clostridium botulinum C/D str. BKT75002]KEI06113.1 hypothetical protein Z954_05750 [Clostridium botulinum C/D str. BKT2873]KGM93680.1 hypothetical protein Z956_10170 [Clostridium botulinum D str. CCUG 7971]KGN01514.1 hypothetical protein Z955_01340 [Clostridium botulinum C/D str. DC5]KOC49834.1 hypothetical protein ADU88_05100 [Clostridium botulinum]